MNRFLVRLLLLFSLGQVASSCSKQNEIKPVPVSTNAKDQNTIPTYSLQPIQAVDIVDGIGSFIFILSPDLESSGGHQIFYWQSTAANNDEITPGSFSYLSSPGALSITTTDGGGAANAPPYVAIIGADHQAYVQYYNNWVLLPSGNLRFNKIFARNFDIGFAGGTPNATGRLFAIGTDFHVYQYNINTNNWDMLGTFPRATDIFVDVFGTPWIIGQEGPNEGTIYLSAGNGQTFNGWHNFAGFGTSISANVDTRNLGIFITGDGYSGGGNDVLWEKRPANPSDPSTFASVWDPNGSLPMIGQQPVKVYSGFYNDIWVLTKNNQFFRAKNFNGY